MADRERLLFISHASADRAVVDELSGLLQSVGWPCWVAGPDSIDGGSTWDVDIYEAMLASTAVLLVLTEAANASPWVPREVQLADDFGRTVVPLRCGPEKHYSRFALRLALDQQIDFLTIPRDESMARLLRTLTNLERSPAAVSEPGPLTRFALQPPDHEIAIGGPAQILELDEGPVALVGDGKDLLVHDLSGTATRRAHRFPFEVVSLLLAENGSTGLAAGDGHLAVFELGHGAKLDREAITTMEIASSFAPHDLRTAGDFVRCIGVDDGFLAEARLAVRWSPRADITRHVTKVRDAAYDGTNVVTVDAEHRLELGDLVAAPLQEKLVPGWHCVDVVRSGPSLAIAGSHLDGDLHRMAISARSGAVWDSRSTRLEREPVDIHISRRSTGAGSSTAVGVSYPGSLAIWAVDSLPRLS